jgi:hypothetical protein
MKYDISFLVELVAAAVARQAPAKVGLTVVMHECHRTLPLLEAAGTTGYINLPPTHHRDFRPVVGGLPSGKERVCATAHPIEAANLAARADSLVVCVPSEPEAIDAMPAFETAGRLCIFYGEPRAGGWSQITPRLRGGDFTPFEIQGARLLISREAVDLIGGRQMLLAAGIGELAAYLAQELPQVMAVEPQSQGLRIRLRPDPLQVMVAGTETLAHNVVMENRALFNSRGIGGLALPLEGRGSLQILVRNVRDRIDTLTIAAGGRAVPLTRIDYTEYGAVLSLPPTPIEAGRDALMFLSLPRSAVPGDGFCDIGAITQTLELA